MRRGRVLAQAQQDAAAAVATAREKTRIAQVDRGGLGQDLENLNVTRM